MNLSVFLCILLSCLTCASYGSDCNSIKSCGECIGHALERCVWCSQENVLPKCQTKKYNMDNINWCKNEFIYNPAFERIYDKNETFGAEVQFLPRHITIKARPGEVVNFTMFYKSADDFPLDVYFLMDYSYTMKTHKEVLQKQVKLIFKGLKKLTKNVRLGVGSFVEKPALPFADVAYTCTATKTTNCTKHYSYAFKNHLTLTNDTDQFEQVIEASEFGSNYDDAEAGLDALMQVMKCEDQLTWRQGSRRVIVLATDSTYHSAGDGRMVGAIKPNDMQCHLKDNEYNHEIAVTHDYPSVSQINKVAMDGKFSIIFAALLKQQDVYEALAKKIKGARYAELKQESNILDIIKKAYEELVKNVEIVFEKNDLFQLEIDQDCKATPPKNCQSKPTQPTVEIPASIKSLSCPTSNATKHNITIFPVGLRDTLNITFEVVCQCDCEKYVTNEPSKGCSLLGTVQCGACKCNPDRGGDTCELNCTDEEHTHDINKCIYLEGGKECNNHGTCRCGKCECESGFSGSFCEYDEKSCPRLNDLICAGNGNCKFAKCECHPHWKGKDCGCPDHNRQCIGPLSATVCSNRGNCDCGVCNCSTIPDTEERYSGAFCDSCEDCAIERCQELKKYAECYHSNSKDYCDDKFNDTAKIKDVEVHLIEKEQFNSSIWSMATNCRTECEDGTFLLFKYQTVSGDQKLQLIIQKEVELPPKANIWISIGSAIGAILLIGLLTAIIWKILIDLYDKKEYDKFCSEASLQGYDVSENPLYEPPSQQFVNPTF